MPRRSSGVSRRNWRTAPLTEGPPLTERRFMSNAPVAKVPAGKNGAEALEVLMKPTYVDRLPPCNLVCPAGENIQEWMQLAQAGRFEEAWRALVANNPMPAIHGRVCYHPCENGCNRKRVDEPVSI